MSDTPQIIAIGDSTVWRTGSAFEKKFGYCRAVRRGPMIAVSGTTAAPLPSDPEYSRDGVLFPGDPGRQAKLAMERSVEAVMALGGKPQDILRVGMFVADNAHCAAVGEAMRAEFGLEYGHETDSGYNQSSGVAATMIVVPGGFVDESMLVEVEVEAFVV